MNKKKLNKIRMKLWSKVAVRVAKEGSDVAVKRANVVLSVFDRKFNIK